MKPRMSTTERMRLVRRRLAERGHALPPLETIRPRAAVGDLAPPSFGQEGIWFLERLGGRQASYGIPATLRLRGRLDIGALQSSLSLLVARHEALRTNIDTVEGKPMQRIASPSDFRLQRVDLRREVRPENLELGAIECVKAEARRPFDLDRGPMVRAVLLQVAEDDFVLVLNVHHIAADGWSMGIVLDELLRGYRAGVAGVTPDLPPVGLQFADFAHWQRQRMQGEAGQQLLRYWSQQLREGPPDIGLAPERASEVSFRGSHLPIQLGARLSRDVERVARSRGCNPYSVLLAAFNAVLKGVTERDDLVVGCTFSNRQRPEIERVVGHFANTLPLRSDLSGDPTFAELVGRTSAVVGAAHQHQELPFPLLVKAIGGRRDPRRHPLFQVVFDFLTPDHNPTLFGYGLSSRVEEELGLPGLKMSPLDVDNGVSRFDIAVFLWNTRDEIAGSVEFSTDLFNSPFVAGLLAAFQELLELGVRSPDSRLSDLLGAVELPSRSSARSAALDEREAMRTGLRRARRRPIRD